MPKIEKKIVYCIFTENICYASGSFLQKYITSVEQRLKFPHLEGSIIP